MKVLIADDHALIRDGMTHAVSLLRPQAEVIAAQDYTMALQLVDADPDFELVLLDLAMPGMDGLEGLTCLHQRLGDTPIVVISATESSNIVKQALDAGARGYIPKSSPHGVLLMALELVLSGGTYIPPELLDLRDTDSQNLNQPMSDARAKTSNINILTRRQKEVIQLLAQGKTNKQISRELGLSEGTVRSHLNAIYKTLDVSNRTQAGRIAAELGLLDESL